MWNKNLNTFAVVEEMCSICPIMSLINVTIRTSVFLHNFYPFFGIKSMFTQKSLKRLTLYTRCFRFNHGPVIGDRLKPLMDIRIIIRSFITIRRRIGRCALVGYGAFFRAFFLLVFSQPFLNPLVHVARKGKNQENRTKSFSENSPSGFRPHTTGNSITGKKVRDYLRQSFGTQSSIRGQCHGGQTAPASLFAQAFLDKASMKRKGLSRSLHIRKMAGQEPRFSGSIGKGNPGIRYHAIDHRVGIACGHASGSSSRRAARIGADFLTDGSIGLRFLDH